MSTNTRPDLAYILTNTALRLFALWIFLSFGINFFYWLWQYFEGSSSDLFQSLPLIHFGGHLLASIMIWLFAPVLANKFAPKAPPHSTEAEAHISYIPSLCFSAVGIFLIFYSLPELISVAARMVWNSSIEFPLRRVQVNLWLEGITPFLRALAGLWIIHWRMQIGQWFLKLRRAYAD